MPTDNVTEMGEAPIGRLLVKFALPSIAMMVVNGLYNVIDRVFIGQGVGTDGIAAVTAAFPLMLVAVAVGGLFGVGSSTLISLALGARREEEAKSILGQALAVSSLAAVMVVGAIHLVMTPVLKLLGATGGLLPLARSYLSIILVGFLFQIPSMGIGGSLRSQARPRAVMLAVLSGVFLNSALAPLFIFGLGWGLAGAAWATVIAQGVVFALTLALIQDRSSRLKIEWGRMRPRLAIKGQMATIGIVGAVYVLFSFPLEGIVQGAQALWGYNYGAGRPDRVRSVTVLVLAWSTAAGALFTLVIELFPRAIVSLFNTSDPRLLALGAHGLTIFFLGFFLFGLSWVAAQFFQAIGRPAKTALLLLGRNLLLIAGMAILPRWLALDGVLWAGPASDLLTAVLSGALLAWGLHALKRRPSGAPAYAADPPEAPTG